MRLLVVSHTPHHRDAHGTLHGWGATVRELEQLAGAVDEIVHVAPCWDGPPPASDRPYRSANIRVVAVDAAGGDTPSEKVGLVRVAPGWERAIAREIRHADAVHVRTPAAISCLALADLALRRRPAVRWYKYAAGWSDPAGSPLVYRAQRQWLKHCAGIHGGTVTVSARCADDGDHVREFLNPALTDDDVGRGREAAEGKTLGETLRLVFAGRLEEAKGALIAVEAARMLAASGRPVRLDLAGDGPARSRIESLSFPEPLEVVVHGWLARQDLDGLYRDAHALVLPSSGGSEGFPKVAAEAMAHGVVPVLSAVGDIEPVLRRVGAGVALGVRRPEEFARAVEALTCSPETWHAASGAAMRAATRFTYRLYVARIAEEVLGIGSASAPGKQDTP